MSISERIKNRLVKDRPMTSITLRIPVDVVESMKTIAPHRGFTGYQTLLKSYLSEGLRRDEAQFSHDPQALLIEELKKRGVSETVLDEAFRKLQENFSNKVEKGCPEPSPFSMCQKISNMDVGFSGRSLAVSKAMQVDTFLEEFQVTLHKCRALSKEAPLSKDADVYVLWSNMAELNKTMAELNAKLCESAMPMAALRCSSKE